MEEATAFDTWFGVAIIIDTAESKNNQKGFETFKIKKMHNRHCCRCAFSSFQSPGWAS